jgi:chemotaxis-related protein WspB
MLLLLFHIGEHLYAIDTAPVTEVIPCMMLRKMQFVPDYVAGVFNYRGHVVRVIDLCKLIQGTSSRLRFSTRIIVVSYRDRAGASHYLGLMAERVTETLSRPDSTLPGSVSTVPYLGDLFMDEQGMIQQVHWEPLVLGDASTDLLEGMLQTDDTGSD